MNRFYLDQDRIIEADMSSDASLQADQIHKAHSKISLRDLGFYFSLYCQQIKKQINKQLNHIVRDFYSRTQIFLDDQVPNQYHEGNKFITLLKQWRPKIQTFQQKYNEFKRSIPLLVDKKKSKFQQPRKIRFLDMLDKLMQSLDSQNKPQQSTNALDTPSKMMLQMQVNKLQALYDQGRYEESINKGKQIGKSGKFPQLYFILGNSYKAMQSYEQAINEYSKAINLAALGCYYNNRGNAYLALQEVSKAQNDYKKAIDLEPRNQVYLGNYGNICLSLRKFQKSIQVYNQAISIDPSNDVFFNNRAFAQIKLKKFDDAIDSYNRALSLNPSNHIYLKNRANLYMQNKMVYKAIEDIKRAIQIEQKHEYYFLKGKWQYLSGKVQAAMLSFSKAHQLEPSKKSYLQYYRALRAQLGFK